MAVPREVRKSKGGYKANQCKERDQVLAADHVNKRSEFDRIKMMKKKEHGFIGLIPFEPFFSWTLFIRGRGL
jgi:hypothetical protein